MTATEIEMMIAIEILPDQSVSDQSILIIHLKLRRPPILPQITTEI